MQYCPDIIAFVESPSTHPERWVLMNVFTRNCLGVGPEVFDFLSNLEESKTKIYRIWNIWRFSNSEGLLADPSRFNRDAATWGEPRLIGNEELVKLLKEQCIIIEDLESYRKRFALKKSLLDRNNFGSYHQQLGQQLIAIERKNPEKWWLEQKFTTDLTEIRKDNLYGAVQDRFLDEWLPQKIKPGMKVLDIGCGAGLISNKLAKLGADVLGVDPNQDYIQLAKERAVKGAKFQQLDLNLSDALQVLPEATFDCIYMSDALLFYFIPYDPNKPINLDNFIINIKRLLKIGGQFISLEPHPVFYIQPWLGDPQRPFTVCTEYIHTQWRIGCHSDFPHLIEGH